MTAPKSITSLQHHLVKHALRLRLEGSYRRLHQTLLLDGLKPIRELASSVVRLFYTPDYASAAGDLPGEKWLVTESIVHKISGMVSPEGILAELRLPPFVSLENARRVLALDAIGDPGNLGTLLRTALALGWDQVYFLPGCCDPFNEKALRAARGAHFKLALSHGTADLLKGWAAQAGVQTLGADLGGMAPESVPWASKRVLVLGNEAHGLSPQVGAFCAGVTIAMPGNMESLNVAVAGGILLYALGERI